MVRKYIYKIDNDNFMDKNPEDITVCLLEVVVMPNGEVICLGKTVGWVTELGKYLSIKPQK